MLTIRAAQILHDWAVAEGLMSEAAEASVSTPADLAMVTPAFEAGKTLLRQKRVVSVGYNEAAREVVVYTRLAAPSGKKAINSLPNRVDDVRVRYRQGNHSTVGEIPAAPFGGPAYVVRAGAGGQRYTCGSSVSVGNCVDSGTLGCLVRNAQGALFGLSNNHVTGSCSLAEVGLPIVAPGIFDVAANGLPPFTIGFHAAALPMVIGSPTIVAVADNSDAAIFRIANQDQVTSHQGLAYDTPAATSALAAGMNVEKVGRTTGHTHGYVDSQIFGPVPVAYQVPRYGFSGQIFFQNAFNILGVGDIFSDSGDSGSLVTTQINGVRHAVGIVVAGVQDGKAPGGKASIVLPIEPILASLGLTLVTGLNI